MTHLGSPFSIHQELWHDCWVAATSAVRAKKKQVDFNIERRVARLLEEYGPESGMPLTLRVYGTMIKGFCVINNERARALHGDCERLVFAFAQKPFGDEGQSMRLPPTRRKMADALTLDLDLAKVQESEAFDWNQAPLEEGALLQLLPQPDAFLPTALEGPPSLLAQTDMLEVSFPALDVPMTAEPVDPSSTVVVLEEAAPMQVEVPADMLDPMAQPPEMAGEVLPPQEMPVGAASVLEISASKRPRHLPKGLEPGRVFGFDEETLMPLDIWESWRRDDVCITRARMRPGAHTQFVTDPVPDRFGRLRLLLEHCDLPAGRQVPQGADARADRLPPPAPGQDADLPSSLVLAGAGPPGFDGMAGQQPDFMDPGYFPAAQPDADLGFLAAPPSPGGGQKGHFDDQTAQVGDVLRRHLQGQPMDRPATMDDLLPPATTDRATAARTFHALLSLATGGEFFVEQQAPYMPICIACA